jgi:hypothetical protein
MNRRIVLVFVLFGCLTLGGCDPATDEWLSLIKQCATSDQLGSDTVYFGASNSIGAGSVYRRRPDGTVALLFQLSDMFPAQSDRDKILAEGPPAQCSGTKSVSWEVKADLPFESGTTSLSADLSADLKKASTTTISLNSWSLETAKETPWKVAVATLDDKNPYKQEVLQPGRYLMETAVKIAGFTASFEYDQSLVAGLLLKYPNGKTISTGPNGISLQVNWTSNTTLSLSSTDAFYALAEYSMLEKGAPEEQLAIGLRVSNLFFKRVHVRNIDSKKTGNERAQFLQGLTK